MNPDPGAFSLMLAQLREGSGTIKAEKSGEGVRASVKCGDARATLILAGLFRSCMLNIFI